MSAQHGMHYPGFKFTVHEYVNSASKQPRDVLEEVYRIVNTDQEWKSSTMSQGIQGDGKSTTEKGTKMYTFNATPPCIPRPLQCHQELKEWGADVTEDEIFRMEDLEEFVGIDLQFIFAAPASVPTASLPPKRVRTRSASLEPEPKRRKLKVGSLVNVVSKPHILPSPYSPLLVNPAKGVPYKKTQPEFILPYTATPSSWDVRLAWLVPIRGLLPWDNATSAEFLDNDDVPVPSTDPSSSGRLLWTQASLRKFWDVLLELRKNQALGLLGVSFHVARQPKQQSTASMLSSFPSQALSLGLSVVDYIKVYHDAPNALLVRNALDIWQYVCQAEDGQTKKIRMLKGSKLVLLDEVSQAVQLS